MAVLQVLKGTETGECLVLDADRSVLGRHPDCDFVLESAAVSRQHACITRDGGDYYIEDLHSRNGTFVNGSQIQGRRLLQDGDQLRICELAFTFFTREPSSVLLGTAFLGPEGQAMPLLLDDGAPTGTIMSKVGVSVRPLRRYCAANPEVKLRAMIEISQSLGKTVAARKPCCRNCWKACSRFFHKRTGALSCCAAPPAVRSCRGPSAIGGNTWKSKCASAARFWIRSSRAKRRSSRPTPPATRASRPAKASPICASGR